MAEPLWSTAPSLLEGVEAGAAPVVEVLRVGALVLPCDEWSSDSVVVEFSWKIPPGK